jgi:hypothetical protein
MEGGRLYTEGQSGTQCESRLAQVALPGSPGEHAGIMTDPFATTILYTDRARASPIFRRRPRSRGPRRLSRSAK